MAATNPPERRRRARRSWTVPGICYAGERAVQVELRDISRAIDAHHPGGGVGLVSPIAFEAGAGVHLKVGIGPLRHPRAATVAYCRRRPDGTFWVGCVLGQASAAAAA